MIFPFLPFLFGSAISGVATAVGTAATAATAAGAIATAVGTAATNNNELTQKNTSRPDDSDTSLHSDKESQIITSYKLEEKIDILQNNIANIRKLSGLQAIQFAKYLQITKQALNNWETKKNKINFAQYVLLTNFFQFLPQIPSIRCDKKTFSIIVSIIVFPELYSRENLKKYQETITALADLSRNNTQVSTIFNALIKELPPNLPAQLRQEYK